MEDSLKNIDVLKELDLLKIIEYRYFKKIKCFKEFFKDKKNEDLVLMLQKIKAKSKNVSLKFMDRYEYEEVISLKLVEFFKNFLLKKVKLNEKSKRQEFLYSFINSEFVGSKFENIVDSKTGKTKKFEVLLETNDSILMAMGFNHRGSFLRELERLEISQELTYHHFKNICKFDSLLPVLNDITYSVNIGKNELSFNRTIEELMKLKETGVLDKIQLEFLENIDMSFLKRKEIPENTVLENKKIKIKELVLSSIKSLGLKINVDDYGSGTSNIEKIKYLKTKFPEQFHSIKLDRDMIIYSSIFSKLLKESEENRREVFDEEYKKHRKSLYNSLVDIVDIVEEENIKKEGSIEELKVSLSNLEKNGDISSVFSAIMSAFLSSKEIKSNEKNFFKLLKIIKEFNKEYLQQKTIKIKEIKRKNKDTSLLKEEIDLGIEGLEDELFKKIDDKILKPIMKKRMVQVYKDTVELSKFLSESKIKIDIIAEFAENAENFYQILKLFDISLLQGYDVFDKKNLIKIQNNKNYIGNIDIQKSDNRAEDFINKIHDLLGLEIYKNKFLLKRDLLNHSRETMYNKKLYNLIKSYTLEGIKNLTKDQIVQELLSVFPTDIVNSQKTFKSLNKILNGENKNKLQVGKNIKALENIEVNKLSLS